MSEEQTSEPRPRGANIIGVFRYAMRATRLMSETSRPLTITLMVATLVAGVAPAAAAYMARIVVDEVLAVYRGDADAMQTAIIAIVIEAVLVACVLAANRAITFAQHLLRAKLAHSVTELILDKAITLELSDFEDPAVHDRLEEARREAATRPLSLVIRSFTLIRYAIALVGYCALLVQLSWWAVLVLIVAGLPSFLAEARFSDESFRFFKSHSPENRERRYIETLLTREEFAKEIGFFGLGPRLRARYTALFDELYAEDRRISIRRHIWGLVFGLLGTASFFGAYLWIVLEAIVGVLTLGQMTMYIVVFRQGQTAVAQALAALGGMYEDALYVENLDLFLDHQVETLHGAASRGPEPDDGLRVENVSWTYPGRDEKALDDVSFHLRPGQTLAVVGHNGSGKSTLVKLLTRRYVAQSGKISLDGLDVRDWSLEALRARISVLFQDFNHYKVTAGENIGSGDAHRYDDREGWTRAAKSALTHETIEALPDGYDTRLGKAFRGATQLSGGQWQGLAFARALMRDDTSLLIFDEPTSAADPRRQAELDERLREILDGRMGVIVSHRLASARIADSILVLVDGKVAERGTHEALIDEAGVYAKLFDTQANAYA